MTTEKKRPKTRKKIRASMLQALLEAHALGEDKPRLKDSQIKVALELLKISEAEKKRAASAKDDKPARGKDTHEDALKELE